MIIKCYWVHTAEKAIQLSSSLTFLPLLLFMSLLIQQTFLVHLFSLHPLFFLLHLLLSPNASYRADSLSSSPSPATKLLVRSSYLLDCESSLSHCIRPSFRTSSEPSLTRACTKRLVEQFHYLRFLLPTFDRGDTLTFLPLRIIC